MGKYRKYAEIPLKQLPNRVWRSYCGGAMIDRWKNSPSCEDGDMPEEWVASTVVARGDNRPENEGVSVFMLPDGGTVPMTELIAGDEEAFLGERIAREYGNPALLTKMLDSRERLTIQDFATYIGYSESYFYRIFIRETGYAPIEYFNRLKINRACDYLLHSSMNVMQIAHILGFSDPYYFSRVFSRIMKISPIKYRNCGGNLPSETTDSPIL